MRDALFFAFLLAVASPAGAVLPDEMLTDLVLEARARDISKNLRCLVCQNQSIDDSDAGLARDLRIIVRERLVAGDSDGAVIGFVVDRYGDFVLLNPPFKASTYVLWIGPGVIGALGLLAAGAFFRRQRATADSEALAPLSDEEKKRFEVLTEDQL